MEKRIYIDLVDNRHITIATHDGNSRTAEAHHYESDKEAQRALDRILAKHKRLGKQIQILDTHAYVIHDA